jgi:hypothetical protein
MDWMHILAYVTGMVDQELLARNEYLAAENRVMKAQLKGRLRLSDSERALLGEIGHPAGRSFHSLGEGPFSRAIWRFFRIRPCWECRPAWACRRGTALLRRAEHAQIRGGFCVLSPSYRRSFGQAFRTSGSRTTRS